MATENMMLGNAGEELATMYLQEKGYRLLERNVQMGHHEVDIVMQDGSDLVFVEVKTRRSDGFCDPMRAVDDEKIWNLMEASKLYKQQHPEYYRMGFRMDVICVVGAAGKVLEKALDSAKGGNGVRLEHYENPFQRRIQNGLPWKSHYRKLRKGHSGYCRIGR